MIRPSPRFRAVSKRVNNVHVTRTAKLTIDDYRNLIIAIADAIVPA